MRENRPIIAVTKYLPKLLPSRPNAVEVVVLATLASAEPMFGNKVGLCNQYRLALFDPPFF